MSVSKALGDLSEHKKRILEEAVRQEALDAEKHEGGPHAYGYSLAVKRPGLKALTGYNPLKDEELEDISKMLRLKRERIQ